MLITVCCSVLQCVADFGSRSSKKSTKTHTRLSTHYICNTLQHTATHCNTLQQTLQHTAAHCNTPQQTAAQYNTLQHTAPHCTTLHHTATHFNTRGAPAFDRQCACTKMQKGMKITRESVVPILHHKVTFKLILDYIVTYPLTERTPQFFNLIVHLLISCAPSAEDLVRIYSVFQNTCPSLVYWKSEAC